MRFASHFGREQPLMGRKPRGWVKETTKKGVREGRPGQRRSGSESTACRKHWGGRPISARTHTSFPFTLTREAVNSSLADVRSDKSQVIT